MEKYKKPAQGTIMEPFCLIFKVKPDSPDHHKQDGSGKVALVFALFDSQKEAEQQAVKLLTRNHWTVTAGRSGGLTSLHIL